MDLPKFISTDFDGTLISYQGKDNLKHINTIKEHIRKGDKVIVVTKRSYFDRFLGMDGEQVEQWVKQKLGNMPVIFTDGYSKFRSILNWHIQIHYDDNPIEIEQLSNDYLSQFFKCVLVDEDKSKERKEANNYEPLPDISDKSVLVVDSGGLYTSFAKRLSMEFGRVYYFNQWRGDMFPASVKEAIGTGIDGVIKVDDIAEVKNTVNVIFFPDCMSGRIQQELMSHGLPVFGSGMASELENKRGYMKSMMEKWELPLVPYKRVVGIDGLLNMLEYSEGNKYIKISDTREDLETYKHSDFINTKRRFDDARRKMGIRADQKEFIVEDELKGQEVGIDTYCILGAFPENVMGGYEIKDASYCGVMFKMKDLPEGLHQIHEKISEYIADNGVSMFYSDEVRMPDDGKYYLTDPTCRLGVPPNESQQCNWLNIGNIILEGANGNLVEPVYRNKYVAQIILKSRDAVKRWLHLNYPKHSETHIFPYSYCCDKDGVHTVPQGIDDHDVVCSVVGLGDTLDEAIAQCLDIASTVKTDGLKYNSNCFDEAKEVIKAGESKGISIFA